jgi:hypothetical protein
MTTLSPLQIRGSQNMSARRTCLGLERGGYKNRMITDILWNSDSQTQSDTHPYPDILPQQSKSILHHSMCLQSLMNYNYWACVVVSFSLGFPFSEVPVQNQREGQERWRYLFSWLCPFHTVTEFFPRASNSITQSLSHGGSSHLFWPQLLPFAVTPKHSHGLPP